MGKYDKKPARGASPGGAPKASSPHTGKPTPPSSPQGNSELDRVAKFLATVKFKPKVFGGVDPADVWLKLEELNRLYEDALVAERQRYDLLLRMNRRSGSPEEAGEDGYG